MHFRSKCLGIADPSAHQPMQVRHQDKLTHNAEQSAARSETYMLAHYINPEPEFRHMTHLGRRPPPKFGTSLSSMSTLLSNARHARPRT